ncbi:ABC transporter substrate-binding protein [Rhodococcus sp. BP-149]|uniref:ABC transporter substrate-binding protein n=1 Tax=unclassified Rhodococcus (in: high G+C Gram-positive bacteria) TaxID=192944 RepID=UPI001C9A5AF7|nr:MULTISPECIES: ABC transporter substrate-binding protein [unclassified Rhodococcus (in: high G+C Gram-positive bacteria)]MBY6683954.1 ABC transporter substrate-binding protein [Rhodococcus sp. BP-288]MBY6693385.1 ABC transporter substrate-binding protein [Rhodococcus sp. BP-188]MBY6697582.1 ABC transporter substrate-binding protein [Rhodococcus sp. BP-285]MBY6702259.1 ABC transporter substrate-binding protein [Rhodococcus sp. BP-283]MBY6709808.1 ABC transporter substrate-binding protein [Rho
MHSTTTRRFATAVAALTLLTAVGCSSDQTSDAAPDTPTGTVTIDHALGSTSVDRAELGSDPRIVTLTVPATDAALALGVQPVAFASDVTGSPDGHYPWQTELAADVPLVPVPVDGTLPIEEIASYAPDLILADFAASTPAQYDQLTALAPTIPVIGDTVSPYDALTRALGTVLGREDAAEAAIARTETALADTAAALPGLAGKTALLSQYIPATQQLVVVADPDDGASAFYQELGMTLPPIERAETAGNRLVVGPERVDILNSDLVIILVNGGTAADLEALPGWADLPSVRSGGMLITDYATIIALNTPSPASLTYALEKVRPTLRSIAG